MNALLALAPLRAEVIAIRSGLGPGAVVLRTGMGPAAARASAARARAVAAGAVVVAGVCGAVSPELRPGDVVVATHATAEDGSELVCDRVDDLAGALAATGARVVVGPIASFPTIAGRETRRGLAARAVAVDMESAWLADAAAGRPVGVVRVVVDTASRHLRDPRTLVAGARALWTLRRLGPGMTVWAAGVRVPTPDTLSRVGWAEAPSLPEPSLTDPSLTDPMALDVHPTQPAIGGSRR